MKDQGKPFHFDVLKILNWSILGQKILLQIRYIPKYRDNGLAIVNLPGPQLDKLRKIMIKQCSRLALDRGNEIGLVDEKDLLVHLQKPGKKMKGFRI